MSIEDYKSIYYMEYTHRVLGRVIGLAFVLPAAYFILRKQVPRKFAYGLGAVGALIGFQGFLGWWMVKSGLKEGDRVLLAPLSSSEAFDLSGAIATTEDVEADKAAPKKSASGKSSKKKAAAK